jgi:hypothetical protein
LVQQPIEKQGRPQGEVLVSRSDLIDLGAALVTAMVEEA